jgi:predicted permease
MWVREVKLAVRSLARQPGLAALAIVTLGLGIGANTAIFSVIDGSLLRPLPYADPDRLVWLSDGHPDLAPSGIDQSVPNLMDLGARSSLLSSTAIFGYGSVNLATEEQPERVLALRASSELLSVLGVPPRMGRDFSKDDDVAGAPRVAILTDEAWRYRFGADPGIVGQTTTVDAASVLIAGVLPPGFRFPRDPELIMPLQHVGADMPRGSRSFYGIGRVADGAELEAVQNELQGIFATLVEEYPGPNKDWHTWAQPLRDFVIGRYGDSLLLFGFAVGLVLLIACVNVANLLIVRADSRLRDFAIRSAMGAERAALVPHFLAEGLVLSIVGGLVGLALAYVGVDALLALFGGSLPRAREIGVNGTALALGLATSLAVGVVVGLVPLLRMRPARLLEHLTDGDRGGPAQQSRLGRVLVTTEVALAVLIVCGAGLLASSVWKLQQVDLGVREPDRALTFQLSIPPAKYSNDDAIKTFWTDLETALGQLPGVEAVGLVNRLPLLGGYNVTNVYPFGDRERAAHFVSIRSVTADYLGAVGARLVAGRWLDASELADSEVRSVVINETLARQLFDGADPLGRAIELGQADEGFRIVGVIGDLMGGNPMQPAPPAIYYSRSADPRTAMSVIVRTAQAPYEALPLVRQTVEELDPQLPVYEIRTLAEIAETRIGRHRVAMSLFGIFAGLALLLGAVGIYGVMSFSVAKRSREIGVRLALGQSRGSIFGLVMRQGARLTMPGLIVGLALALASSRVLGSLLYGVSPLDPATYAAVAGVLALVSFVATYVPAHRATRVDPLVSMRSE